MVTIYKSIDCKEFTNETACKKHEKEIALSSNIKNEIIFYDKNGQQIDFFEGIKYFDEEVWYIWAKTNEATTNLEALIDEEECCLYGLGGKGFYFFNQASLRWDLIDEYEQGYSNYIRAKKIKEIIEKGN